MGGVAGRVVHVIARCVLFTTIKSEIHITGSLEGKVFQEIPFTVDITDNTVVTVFLRIFIKLHLCDRIAYVGLYISRWMEN